MANIGGGTKFAGQNPRFSWLSRRIAGINDRHEQGK
jgi:hypothetical protein